VTDGNIPGKLTQRILIEYLGHQPHISVNLELFTISGGNTSAFLTAVLKGEQSKKGKPSYILMGGINTNNAATFVQAYLPTFTS
jgi:hypothetical protein